MRTRTRGRTLRRLALGPLVCLLLAACGAGAEDPSPVASPTATFTPSGDVLRIDGAPMRQIFIPVPGRNPLYAATDRALFAQRSGQWIETRTTIDARWLLVDPVNPLRLFRGDHPPCDLSGDQPVIPLEVSQDGGASWRSLGQGRNIRPLAFDPSNPDVVYGSDCGLAISTTNGNTWSRFDPIRQHTLSSIVVLEERLLVLGETIDDASRLMTLDVTDPAAPILGDTLLDLPGRASFDANDDRIVVGSVDGIHVSDDGGATWSVSRAGLEAVTTIAEIRPDRTSGGSDLGVSVVRLDPHNKRRIFIGTAHGLFLSQDDGATWVRYDTVSLAARVIDIEFGANDADLYVTTDQGVVVVPSP